MGAGKSKLQQQENAWLEKQRDELRRAREEQHQEVLNLEKEKALLRRAHEDLKVRQLEENLRRLNQSQLYPNLNHIAGPPINETYQTNAAANLTVNHDHFRYQPSAPPAPVSPTVCQPSETRALPPRPRPRLITAPQAATVRAAGTAPQAATVRTSVTAPQAATVRATGTAPQAATVRATGTTPKTATVLAAGTTPKTATVRASVTAPQATTVRAAGTAPQAATVRTSVTAPQAATVRATGTAPQAATVRATGTTPKTATVLAAGTTPQAATVRATGTTPKTATVRASVTAPQATTVRASVAAPREKKGFTWRDDSHSCQTCKKPYEDKIFNCKNGHSACESCWSLDVKCGQCNGPITDRRNFGLEEHFVANRPVKCPNAADGCRLTFKKPEFLTKHEKECPFKELECPSLETYCNWRGKITQLTNHFDEEHPSSRQANVDTEMCLSNICNEHNSMQLIKLGTYNFLFFIKVSEIERCVYMDIQLIGTKTSASKWHYEIHVYNKRQPRRKYQYVNSCHSSNDTQGISLRSCAVLPLPYARSFFSEGNLNYKIFIKRNMNVKQN